MHQLVLYSEVSLYKCAMWNFEVCNFEVNTALTGHRNKLYNLYIYQHESKKAEYEYEAVSVHPRRISRGWFKVGGWPCMLVQTPGFFNA